MRFGIWYPLAEAAAHAPSSAGVFQIRLAEGLRDYPRGKSAMVHYEAAADVRAAATAFAEKHPGEPWVCRHTIEMVPADVAGLDAFFGKLIADFVARFGERPTSGH